MNFNKILNVFIALLTTSALADIPPTMSPLISESKSEFTGTVLLRYTRFNTESEYPCMRFETIDPTNDKLLETKDYCEITLPFFNNLKVNTRTDVQSVDYTNFKLTDNTFTFEIDLITAMPGAPSFLLNCSLTLNNDEISEVACTRKDDTL
tara:strand:+ start:78 stop:530 length:453 start_codon:yes stop_codon:yes gene_type:complete